VLVNQVEITHQFTFSPKLDMSQIVSVGDGMRYALAEQERLWVDADAFEAKVTQALRAVDTQDALPSWEEAYRLARRGQFLEDNLYQDWTQARRDTLHGKMSECVYALADLYSGQQRYDLARELLWETVETHPGDEDTLYRLLLLLERQERYQAAWQLYRRAKDLLAQDGLSLTPRTHAAVKRIRKHMTAQEVPAEAFSITPLLPMTSFTPVFDTVPGGMMIDCATWFALKQAEITTLVNQWCGHAQHCDELQIRLSTMMSQLDERQPGHNPSLTSECHTHLAPVPAGSALRGITRSSAALAYARTGRGGSTPTV
jgi:tetratricopeptide (TPR) repeat protein